MNIIRALLIILGCLAAGETAVFLAGIKLPGSIVGMGVLFALLQAGWVKTSWLQQLTDALMANLTLFLVPPCVAVISYLDLIADDWFSILVSASASTLCVLLVTGKVHRWIRSYLMNEILRQPSVLLFLTLAVYALAIIVRTRTGNIFCNPVLVSTVVLIAYLKILDIDYAVYHNAAQFIDFWLKPAVVVLAVPLYQNRRKIFNQWLPVIVSQLAGSVTGIVTGMYFAKWLGAEREVVLSLASKSVTNPIAIEITRSIGGIPAITAATVIIAGLVGQIAGYKMLKNTVVMPSSVGMSLGTASHAMGIAASLERSRRMAAYAGLGLTFNGVLTALIAPLLIPVLGF